MQKRELVSEIMIHNVVTLNPEDNLTKAEELFERYQIRHLPVVENNKIIGMLSYTDLMRVSCTEAVQKYQTEVDVVLQPIFTVKQVMTENVTCVNSKNTIEHAAQMLSEKKFHALPVVDNGILIGIISTTDLAKELANKY